MKMFMQAKESILLLGGTGFIGQNMIHSILEDNQFSNFQIIVLSRKILDKKSDSIIYEVGDFGDKETLVKLFDKWNIVKVFHLASSTIPISSNKNIINDLRGNLISTITLLEVMKDFGCNFILYLSSGGAVYGENKVNAISEKELCFPISSYGVVKLSIENYLRLYQKQFGIDYLILRISNPFGEFHVSEEQGVINIAIRRAVKRESIEIWGDGSQSKDYIYIYDLIKIINKLLESNILNQTINIGSGKATQLNMILNRIKTYIPDFNVNYIDSKPTDIKDFCLDITLLKSLVDFEFTDFETAIKNTILWEEKQLNN